jgi:hypothetical protein
MGQTIKPGNAYFPVAPDFDPPSLDNLLDPYPYFPRFRSGIYEGAKDEGV